MKLNIHELNGANDTESMWQTLAGCALFWAGLLALFWML